MEGTSKGLRKGAWTAEEDSLLRQCIDKYGEGKWHQIPSKAGLNRCRKSCRLRWLNYLKPTIKRGKLSCDEVDLLLRLHKLLGNRWSLIAGRLPGRTANDVKNYWNTHLSKTNKSCCKTKMKKRQLPCSSTTLVQKIEVFKPRPRSFNNSCSHLNGQPEVDTIPPCHGHNKISNVSENSFKSNKDEEKHELGSKFMDGENMWWENLLDDGQDPEVPRATENGKTTAFDVEELWNLLDEETAELH